MKKYIFLITLLLGSLLNTGCSDWLDVRPQSEIPKDKLFETENGFRSALTGAYIRLKSSALYGGALMWGDIEYMASNWYNTSSSNTTISQLINCNYNDAGVVGKIDAIYQNLYKVIADVNSILEVIDSKKDVFSEKGYEMIKGEALTIRAFCHFDVLRLFGPVPNNVGETLLFPYVTEVTKEIHPAINYQDYSQAIINDLDAASALLKTFDPIIDYSLSDLRDMDKGDFITNDNYTGYRNLRMNYYAALAIKARVYLWLSASDATNKTKAAECAQEVIDAKEHTGTPTFRLGVEADRVAGDYTFSAEHIMALNVYNLTTIAQNQFGDTGPFVRYDFSITDGYYYLNNLFPVAERVSDIRWINMWTYRTASGQTQYVMYKKFIQNVDEYKRILQVPMLRLSEMYLILAECANDKGTAEAIYKTYCDKKGIPFTSFSSSDWLTDRRNKILREYVREFYGEGQTFFTYKRLNVTSLPAMWTPGITFSGSAAKYVAPKPLREIEYHNK